MLPVPSLSQATCSSPDAGTSINCASDATKQRLCAAFASMLPRRLGCPVTCPSRLIHRGQHEVPLSPSYTTSDGERTTSFLSPRMTAISSRTTSAPARLSSLPQIGFGVDYTYHTLAEHNSFLFRVHSPKGKSRAYEPTGQYPFSFVAEKFNGESFIDPKRTHSYQDVATHLDLMTRSSSPYISTSFSFAWALWEALRRHRINPSADIEIAIIDARQVLDRAVTVTDILRSCPQQERHEEYWDWYQFSLESQDVFIYGSVPPSAVLSSIPLHALAGALPTYYFHDYLLDNTCHRTRLQQLAADHAHHQSTYHQFCQDISGRFARMTTEEKLCESTTGAVHLALGFLRPWVSTCAMEGDHDHASAVINDLACSIAQWPAKHWVSTEHPEVFDMVDSISHLVGLEIRRKHERESMDELSQLQDVITGLQYDIGQYVRRGSISESVCSESTLLADPEPLIKDGYEEVPPRRSSVREAIVAGFCMGTLMTMCFLSSQSPYISNQFT